MERSSHGSRLLGFHRAHGIPDSRAHAPRAPQTQPAQHAHHVVHGARPRPTPPVDGATSLVLAIITVLLVSVAAILWAPTTQLMPPADEQPAAEVAR